jgi:hypothetical protein
MPKKTTAGRKTTAAKKTAKIRDLTPKPASTRMVVGGRRLQIS